MKKLKQITEDFQFLEKKSTPEDLIQRVVQKAISKPRLKGKRKPMDPEERDRKAKERDKKGRTEKLLEGICTRCQKALAVWGGRRCQPCRELGARYVKKSESKKMGYYDD